MQSKKFRILLLGIIFMAVSLTPTSCSRVYDNGHLRDNKLIVGLSMDTLKEERWYKDRDDFVSEVGRLGGSVLVSVAYDSDDVQYDQVKSMIDKKIDVLVIIPHDAQVAAKSVQLAKSYGVKVISYDRLVRKANADLYISFDNVKVGELMANSILKAVPSGNYVIIDGPSTDYNTVMISEGIKKVLDPYLKKGSIRIVKETSTTDWMADEASNCISKLIQDSVKFDAVIAENDSLAGGVISTLSENRLSTKIPVVGMDADLSACQRVVEGQQMMTVYKPINQLAHAAVEYAVLMAKGENIKVSGRISDGEYNVPYFTIDPIAVDKDNMVSTVIEDKFHTLNEVYMNIPLSEWPYH